MRMIGRIVILLVAAGLIAGPIYLVVGGRVGDPSRGARTSFEGREAPGSDPDEWAWDEQPDGHRRHGRQGGRFGEDDGERRSVGRGLGGMITSVVIIALITFLVNATRIRRFLGLAAVQ